MFFAEIPLCIVNVTGTPFFPQIPQKEEKKEEMVFSVDSCLIYVAVALKVIVECCSSFVLEDVGMVIFRPKSQVATPPPADGKFDKNVAGAFARSINPLVAFWYCIQNWL